MSVYVYLQEKEKDGIKFQKLKKHFRSSLFLLLT